MKRQHPAAAKTSARRGSTLPLFAVLLFAMIPLMSLVVHVGLITLTRRQMQTAVNTAALEGLRFRDDAMTESDRRDQVSDLVANNFDDDLDPGNGQGISRLGIGPDVELSDGIALPGTDFRASTTITSAQPYQPYRLQRNLDDELTGDMLAGQYVPTGEHSEANDYQRQDFLIEENPNYDAAIGNDALLVRMRRSGETSLGADVGSAGPPVPYLFGRGAYGPSSSNDEREHGTIVRATAIAQAVPALRVGLRNDALSLTGLLNLQMDIDDWIADTPLTLGTDFEDQAQLIETTGPEWQVTTVGANPFSHDDDSGLIGAVGYVLLTDDVLNNSGDPVRRIIGFGRAENVVVTAGEVSFTRGFPQPIASTNASAILGAPPTGWQNLNLDSLFGQIQTHAHAGYLLEAPAHRRAIR